MILYIKIKIIKYILNISNRRMDILKEDMKLMIKTLKISK